MSQWNATCVPPWSDSELTHKLTDAKYKIVNDGTLGQRALKKFAPVAAGRHALPDWIERLPHSGPGRLTLTQRSIMQAVADRCEKTIDNHGSMGWAVIGLKDLTKAARVSYATLCRHLPVLRSMGLLAKPFTGGITFGECLANIYAIPGAHGIVVPDPPPTLCGNETPPPHPPTG